MFWKNKKKIGRQVIFFSKLEDMDDAVVLVGAENVCFNEPTCNRLWSVHLLSRHFVNLYVQKPARDFGDQNFSPIKMCRQPAILPPTVNNLPAT